MDTHCRHPDVLNISDDENIEVVMLQTLQCQYFSDCYTEMLSCRGRKHCSLLFSYDYAEMVGRVSTFHFHLGERTEFRKFYNAHKIVSIQRQNFILSFFLNFATLYETFSYTLWDVLCR